MHFMQTESVLQTKNRSGPAKNRFSVALVLSHSKTGQGTTMAETLIIILAEHNVPINFADHFTKLVSNKLVFPDSVFLCMRAATLLAKSSHRGPCH